MAYEDLLNKEATIKTETIDYTTSGDGTLTKTWSAAYTKVKCALQKTRATLKEIEAGYDPQGFFKCFMLIDQTIERGNRVVIDSITYHVEDVDDAAGRGHHIEARLRLLEI